MPRGLTEILAEAKRRRVFRTAGVYLVAVWGISQGAAELGPLFGAADWMLRWGLIGALALLPVVAVLAWMFDIGRGGIVRDPEDALAQKQAEAELADMPTQLGGDEPGVGAVIVRWADTNGQNASIFVDEFFLGRGNECRVRFYDPLVSRKHARVYHVVGGAAHEVGGAAHQAGDATDGGPDTWVIEDLGSRNGTIVDEKRVERAAIVDEHDVRVNEAGPVLRLEFVPPGAQTREALAAFPPGQSVAHVRTSSLDFDRTRGSGALKR